MPNVYIRVEISKRELEAKILLALASAEKGFTNYVGVITQERILKWGLPPGIFHDQNAMPTDASLLARSELISRGHVITLQDEEHGLMVNDYEIFAKERFAEETIKQAQSIFCWGMHDYSYLSSRYPGHSDTFIATGSPRVDTWKQKFAPVFDRPVSGLKYPDAPFILMVSNSGNLGSEFSVGSLFSLIRTMGNSKTQQDMRKTILSLIQMEAFNTQSISIAVNEMHDAHPDLQILIRPHPIEDGLLWREIFHGKPFVTISNQDSASPAIRQCTVLLQGNCTTSLEARLAGTPLVSLHDNANSDFNGFQALGISVNSGEDAYRAMNRIFTAPDDEDRSLSESERNFLTSRLANFEEEGPLASDLIAERWAEVSAQGLVGAGRIRRTGTSLKMHSRFQHHVKDRLGQSIAKAHPAWSKAKVHSSQERLFAGISEGELRMIVNAFRKSTGRFQDIDFEVLTPTLFRIFPKGHRKSN